MAGKEISDKNKVEKISNKIPLEEEQTFVESSFLPSYTKSFSQTRIKKIVYDYTWKIDQFKDFSNTVDILCSAPFPESGQYMIQMNFPNQTNPPSDVIKLYLLTKEAFTGICTTTIMKSPETILLSKTISGLISDMTSLIEMSKSTFFSNNCSNDRRNLSNSYQYEDEYEDTYQYDTRAGTYSKSKSNAYSNSKNSNNSDLYLDTLQCIVHCKLELFQKIINNSLHMNLLPSSTISKNVKDLTLDEFESINGKPIIFIIEKEQYVIQKKLLYSTNSNYFKNIYLTHEGKEIDITSELTKNNEVQAFKHILLFIINGPQSVESYDYGTLKELLRTADKYDVSNLKLTCEHYLLRHITIKNAVELKHFAFLYDAECLKTHSAKFIEFHIKEIMNTEEFQKLPQESLNFID